jgi:choice-of-anchor B domain-containing protein
VSVLTVASPVRSQSVQLLGWVDIPLSQYSVDVWGWVDPQTQIEYALVGNNASGVHIVDVSDPYTPTIVATIDTIPKFDLKAQGHYMYTVDGNYDFAGIDGAITDISDPLNPVVVGGFRAGHNVFIDDLGYMYVTFPGLEIFDLNPDPTDPALVWSKITTQGHDVTVEGDRMYDFHGYDGTFIYDVTDRADPVLLGAITDPTIIFHHSGWCSADGDHLFINDEFAVHPAPDVTVWDISNPASPVRVSMIHDPTASVHNSYRIGNYLFMAYYTAGFKVYDISDPLFPFQAGAYDTSTLTGEYIFDGAWGCYPFAPSEHIYINDRKGGFFVFSFDETLVAVDADIAPEPFVLHQNHPNPFNPATTIRYQLSTSAPVTLDVLDVSGRRVATLVDEVQPAGFHDAVWDGTTSQGQRAASGVYFYRLRIPGFSRSAKMTLVE